MFAEFARERSWTEREAGRVRELRADLRLMAEIGHVHADCLSKWIARCGLHPAVSEGAAGYSHDGGVVGAMLAAVVSAIAAGTWKRLRAWDEPRGQRAKGWNHLDRLYRAAGRWFYLCAPRGLDAIPELAGADEAELAAVLRTATAAVWVSRLVAAGAGAHILEDLPDLMDDPIVRSRGLAIEREHPGFGRACMAGPARRLSMTPTRPASPVGPPGADTRAVLDSLGFDSHELIQRDIARDGLPDGTTFVGMFR